MTDIEKIQNLAKREEDCETKIKEAFTDIAKIYKEKANLLNEMIEKEFPKKYITFKKESSSIDKKLQGKDAFIQVVANKRTYSQYFELYLEAYPIDDKGNMLKRPQRIWGVYFDEKTLTEKGFVEQIESFADPYSKEIVNEFEKGNEKLLKKHLYKLVDDLYRKDFFNTYQTDGNILLRFSDSFLYKFLDAPWNEKENYYQVCSSENLYFGEINDKNTWEAKTITKKIWDCLNSEGYNYDYVDGFLEGMAKYYERINKNHEAKFLTDLLNKYIELAKEYDTPEEDYDKDEDEMER